MVLMLAPESVLLFVVQLNRAIVELIRNGSVILRLGSSSLQRHVHSRSPVEKGRAKNVATERGQ